MQKWLPFPRIISCFSPTVESGYTFLFRFSFSLFQEPDNQADGYHTAHHKDNIQGGIALIAGSRADAGTAVTLPDGKKCHIAAGQLDFLAGVKGRSTVTLGRPADKCSARSGRFLSRDGQFRNAVVAAGAYGIRYVSAAIAVNIQGFPARRRKGRCPARW